VDGSVDVAVDRPSRPVDDRWGIHSTPVVPARGLCTTVDDLRHLSTSLSWAGTPSSTIHSTYCYYRFHQHPM